MAKVKRDKVRKFQPKKLFKQGKMGKFKEVLYLYRHDLEKNIYVLAFDPGKEGMDFLTENFNYTTELKTAFYNMSKIKRSNEYRIKFLSPEGNIESLDTDKSMDRVLFYNK